MISSAFNSIYAKIKLNQFKYIKTNLYMLFSIHLNQRNTLYIQKELKMHPKSTKPWLTIPFTISFFYQLRII